MTWTWESFTNGNRGKKVVDSTQIMTRQLIICIDGTNNRFSDQPTNVLRVFRTLPKNSEALLAYYDQGVGTFGLSETLFEWQKLPCESPGWRLAGGSSVTCSMPIVF